jgi:hypothetical protein
MIDTTKLAIDLREAIAKGREAIEGMEDNGTCNFDGIMLSTGKDCQVPRKSNRIADAIRQGGGSAHHKGYGIRRGYVISLPVGGQGMTRTKAAEVACDHLRAAGYEVSMWYQMD